MSESSGTPLTQKFCDEATVYVSVAVDRGNPIITVRIVPKGDVGALTILSDSVAMVQGAAMAGLRDTLKRPPWKDIT